MNIPAISVGIPVRNGERFLARAIDSVLAQTYRNFELLVIDNASDDSTPEIAANYAALDPRVRYLANPVNLGAAANFNRAFAESSGDYFAWLSSDDYWEPEFLERCLVPLESDRGCVLAFPMVRVVDEDDHEIERVDGLSAIDSGSAVERFRMVLYGSHNSYYVFGLMRSAVLGKTRLILPHAHGDTILIARLSLLGRFAKINKHLFVSRQHPAQSNKVFQDSTQAMGFNFADYSRWFGSPGASSSVRYPYAQTLLEYYKASTDVPIGLMSRIRCRALLLRLVRGYRRGLLADARRFATRLVGADR